MFTIMLLDEKGETLITRYAWRFGHAHAPSRRISITSGLVGAAVREWRFINVPDVRKDARYTPMNEETRSELVMPLFYKGRIIGVLDLEHTRAAFFHEEHERILATMAAPADAGPATRAPFCASCAAAVRSPIARLHTASWE